MKHLATPTQSNPVIRAKIQKNNRRPRRLRLLAGAVCLIVAGGVVAGLLVSQNGAAQSAIDTSKTSHLHVLVIDPADSKHVLLGQHTGLVESRDGGGTWQVVAGPLGHTMLTGLAASGTHTVFAAGSSETDQATASLWTSSNDARTWTRTALPAPDLTTFAAFADNPHSLILSTFHAGLFMTVDDGKHWRHLAGRLQDLGITSMATDPYNAQQLVVGTLSGLYESTDAGRSWHTPTFRNTMMTALAFAPAQPGQLFVASATQMWQGDTAGQHWVSLGTTPNQASITTIAVSAQPQNTLLVGTTTGLYTVSLARASWTLLGGGTLPMTTVAVLSIDPHNARTIYAGYSFPTRLYRSNDAGQTWTKIAG